MKYRLTRHYGDGTSHVIYIGRKQVALQLRDAEQRVIALDKDRSTLTITVEKTDGEKKV